MNKVAVDNSKPCECCGFYANRGIGVDGIVVKDNKILLVKRKGEPFKGWWSLPGGFIDWNISAEETVVKEMKEETNLDVIDMKFVQVRSKPDRHPRQSMALVYELTVSGDLQPGDDALEAEYFDFNQLPEKVGFDHVAILQEYRGNR